jgi:hypothetical protein
LLKPSKDLKNQDRDKQKNKFSIFIFFRRKKIIWSCCRMAFIRLTASWDGVF